MLSSFQEGLLALFNHAWYVNTWYAKKHVLSSLKSSLETETESFLFCFVVCFEKNSFYERTRLSSYTICVLARLLHSGKLMNIDGFPVGLCEREGWREASLTNHSLTQARDKYWWKPFALKASRLDSLVPSLILSYAAGRSKKMFSVQELHDKYVQYKRITRKGITRSMGYLWPWVSTLNHMITWF